MITEEQLSIWAKAPVATKYKYTHEQIRKALEKYISDTSYKNNSYRINSSDYEVYLQGSYANSTNIKIDSDVDVVVQLNKTFSYNIDQLTETQKKWFSESYGNSTYNFINFKKDVQESLQAYFNSEVIEYGKKSLKIPGNTNRVNADVVPAFKHKKYERFFSTDDKEYIHGIKIINTENRNIIINYPKEHLKNCSALNHDTEEKFKDTVRIFKNLKRKLVKDLKIKKDAAPSYFIENLIYNSPAEAFNGSYQEMLKKIFQNWLNDTENGRMKYYKCANGQDLLFLSKNMWDINNAKEFITKSANLFLNN